MKETLTTPVGRLVLGSLYKPQTKDMEGRPLMYKDGKPRVKYYFGIAIPKSGEQHWKDTKWGSIIWNCGHTSFPNGQAGSPNFAWKINDGDSMIPNVHGKKPCEMEGHKGHWILNFSCDFAPVLVTDGGKKTLTEADSIKLGDYIEVYGNVSGNESDMKPGIYLNHIMVHHAGYGERIVFGPDAESVGFGSSPLPAGASKTPLASGFAPVATVVTPPVPPPVKPYPAILNTSRTLTAKAGQFTYEQLIANGWTDAILIEQGYMNP